MSKIKTDDFFEFEINTSSTSELDYYDSILSNFPEWKATKRELKILSITEGKKIQFEVNQISSVLPNTTNNGLWGSFGNNDEGILSISKVCFILSQMNFIIQNQKIEKLTIGIKTLTTEYGKILHKLLNEDWPIEIEQAVEKKSVNYFYIKQQNLAA